MFVPFYWLLPLISALTWLGMLLGLLLQWVTSGEPRYPSEDPTQTIPYISDTGAFTYKPLFIAAGTVTVVLLDLSLIAERWLRHNGRLAPNTSTFQKILSILAILSSIAGAIGLILLTIFDTYRHPNMHDRCLIVFIAGYVLSAIFICWEFQRLGVKFRSHPVLRASFWVKLGFIIVEIGLAIAFGVLDTDSSHLNTAAVLEWVVALVYSFYVLSFVMDLLPAVRTHHHGSHPAVAEMAAANGYSGGYANGDSGNGYVNGDSGYVNGNSGYVNGNSGYVNGNSGYVNGRGANPYVNGGVNGYTQPAGVGSNF